LDTVKPATNSTFALVEYCTECSSVRSATAGWPSTALVCVLLLSIEVPVSECVSPSFHTASLSLTMCGSTMACGSEQFSNRDFCTSNSQATATTLDQSQTLVIQRLKHENTLLADHDIQGSRAPRYPSYIHHSAVPAAGCCAIRPGTETKGGMHVWQQRCQLAAAANDHSWSNSIMMMSMHGIC